MSVIDVKNLTKRYGDGVALDDVSFTVPPGRVTGFLGPNGAGKSTCMRVIAGLTSPTSGTATILGRPFADLTNPGREVGILLDASAQHGGRTGREVLKLGAVVMGLKQSRVDEMFEVVGLSQKEADRRVGQYSLGMRQRLGIAHALLGDPGVLVLDEPANGLDPAGIRWMRSLLAEFAGRGGAVLLSSHLLHEIEVVADELVVIGRGRIIAQGTKSDLLAEPGTSVKSADDRRLADSLRRHGFEVTEARDLGLIVDADPFTVGEIAVAEGIALGDLRPTERRGLEDLFLRLTAGDSREDTAL